MSYETYIEDEIHVDWGNPSINKTVIIYRGLPGSGKSTSISNSFPNASVCSADHHFYGADGVYNFIPWEVPMAHQICYNNFIKLLFAEEELVIVDNTNMCQWEYMNYAELAQQKGYKVRIICMAAGLHDSTSIASLAERNKHGVDANTITKMRARYEAEYGEEIV